MVTRWSKPTSRPCTIHWRRTACRARISIENSAVIGLLRAMHVVPEEAASCRHRPRGRACGVTCPQAGTRAEANALLLGRTSRTWQRFYEWMDNYHLPARRLMVRYKGSWADARKDFQAGKLSETTCANWSISRNGWSTVAAEIVSELKGACRPSAPKISPAITISVSSARTRRLPSSCSTLAISRAGAAVDIGGRETGAMLDTNAYTAPEHANLRAARVISGSRMLTPISPPANTLATRNGRNTGPGRRQRRRGAPQGNARLDRTAASKTTGGDVKEPGQSGSRQGTRRAPSELRLVEDSAKGRKPTSSCRTGFMKRPCAISAKLIDTYKKTTDPAKRAEIAQQIRNARQESLFRCAKPTRPRRRSIML